MIECELYIVNRKDKKRICTLGAGMLAVIDFYELARAGIPGAMDTDFSFNANVDVTIRGKELRDFLQEHYPDWRGKCRERIEDAEEYLIVCYDIS